jgi:hypothetical protein
VDGERAERRRIEGKKEGRTAKKDKGLAGGAVRVEE